MSRSVFKEVPKEHLGPYDVPHLGWLAVREWLNLNPWKERQGQALRLTALGFQEEEMARPMGISAETLPAHSRAIRRRLLAVNMGHATRIAYEAKVLKSPPLDSVLIVEIENVTPDMIRIADVRSRGYGPAQTAALLGGTEGSVKHQMKKLYSMLAVHNLPSAVTRLYQLKVFVPGEAATRPPLAELEMHSRPRDV